MDVKELIQAAKDRVLDDVAIEAVTERMRVAEAKFVQQQLDRYPDQEFMRRTYSI